MLCVISSAVNMFCTATLLRDQVSEQQIKKEAKDSWLRCDPFTVQGPVVRSMVSANHWLSSIKINRLSWYLTLVSVNQASSNSAQAVFSQSIGNFVLKVFHCEIVWAASNRRLSKAKINQGMLCFDLGQADNRNIYNTTKQILFEKSGKKEKQR